MNERRILLTHRYDTGDKSPVWDRSEQLAKILSLVLIPLVVAWLGSKAEKIVDNTNATRLDQQRLLLAWEILSTPVSTSPDEAESGKVLRSWAVRFIWSGVDATMTEDQKQTLIKSRITLPPPPREQSSPKSNEPPI
jgi:hypothetical protein